MVRVAERRPHRARGPERGARVHEVDPIPVRPELDVGGLDQAVEHDQPAGREHERRQHRAQITGAPRLCGGERDDGERNEREHPVVRLIGADEAEARVDAEDRRQHADGDHCEDRPVQPRTQIGQLGVRERVDEPQDAEDERTDHQQGELRRREPLGGARVERHGERDHYDEGADAARAAQRVGALPQLSAGIDDGNCGPRHRDHEECESERGEDTDDPEERPERREAGADEHGKADAGGRRRALRWGALGPGLRWRRGGGRGLLIDDDRRLSRGLGGRWARRAVRGAPRLGHRVSIGARPQPIGSPRASSYGTRDNRMPESTARIATAAVRTYADVRSMRLTTNATIPRQMPIV